jgi:hypothetical protein
MSRRGLVEVGAALLIVLSALAVAPSASATPPNAPAAATSVTVAPGGAGATASQGQTVTPAQARAAARQIGLHTAAHPPATTSHGAVGGSGGGGGAPPAGRSAPGATTPSSAAPASLSIAQSNCVPETSTAAGLQSAFNIRGPAWGGGDGAQPVPIDGGRTLWLFGDTYIGGGPYGGPLTSSGIVHNSMVVQYNNTCFAYLMGTNGYAWASAIPEPNATDWYWPDDGTYDAATGVLSIVAMHMRVTTGGQWGWTEVGVDVLHYAVEPSITLLNTETLFTYGPSDPAQFGQSILVTNGITQLYGCAQTGPPACYLARTDLELDPGTLQFRTASGWSTAMSQASPLGLTQLSGTELHVLPVDGAYLATNQIPVLSTATQGWWSTSSTGPFVPTGPLFDEAQPPLGPNPSNWFTYGGRLIQTSAGPIGVYSVNTWDDEAARVAGVYGPRFVGLDSHTLDRTPFGWLDSATPRSGGTEVTGWSTDPDTTAPINVQLTVDGVATMQTTASLNRPDVAAVYPAWGPDHGFDAVLALGPGIHTVCAYGLNVIAGFSSTPLGCLGAGGAGPPARFVSVGPTRILDSRDGTGGYATPWSPDQTRSLPVTGVAGVPTGATAVVLNLTVTDAAQPGFVTVAPAGGVVPLASNLNFVAGQTIANLVTVPVGAGGQILLSSGHAQVDLVVDLVGYDVAGPSGAGYTAVSPSRILDSRDGTGGPATPWTTGETRVVPVAGHGGVPSGATAVVVNLTATDTTNWGYVTAWPDGGGRPGTSNLNFGPGQTIANLATVPLGPDGAIDLFNFQGRADLVADVVGYYALGTGGPMVALGPLRILDSRNGTGGPTTPWATSQTRVLHVTGRNGIPVGATAVVVNLTATDTTDHGYVTAWPDGGSRPGTSNLNFGPGQTIANLATVPVGADGAIDLFNFSGNTDLVADVVGYYTAS